MRPENTGIVEPSTTERVTTVTSLSRTSSAKVGELGREFEAQVEERLYSGRVGRDLRPNGEATDVILYTRIDELTNEYLRQVADIETADKVIESVGQSSNLIVTGLSKILADVRG